MKLNTHVFITDLITTKNKEDLIISACTFQKRRGKDARAYERARAHSTNNKTMINYWNKRADKSRRYSKINTSVCLRKQW